MVTTPIHHCTPEEYLAFERSVEGKNEYRDGQIFPMPRINVWHTTIMGNIGAELHNQLRNRPAQGFMSIMRVKVAATGEYLYPDVVVVRDQTQLEDEYRDTLLNPTIIIEVMTPTSESYDRGEKFHHYERVATLTDYVLIAQDRVQVDHFVRRGDQWLLTATTDLSSNIHLASIDCTLTLSEIYDDVEFPNPPPVPPGFFLDTPTEAAKEYPSATTPIRRCTPEEYLAFERSVEYKNEYRDGQIFLMPAINLRHNRITVNIGAGLSNQLHERAGAAFISMMRIKVAATGAYLYPDVVAFRDKEEVEDAYQDTLLNPTVIFEVLSPDSEAYDRGEKFFQYRQLTTLTDYVLVAQDRPWVEHYVYRSEGWLLLPEATDLGDRIQLPAIDCTLTLAEIYRKVEFPDPPPASPGH